MFVSLLVLSTTITLAFTEETWKWLPFSLLHWQRSMWRAAEASSHQRNIGTLPRLPSRCLSLLRARSRIWRNAGKSARSPRIAIVLASLSVSALFSASQTGERPRYNASPTPSRLSCHWLHMRNNETSLETRLQKGRGGFDIIFF